MYQKSFPKINAQCTVEKDGVVSILTPKQVIQTSQDAGRVMRWAYILEWMINLSLWTSIFEWIMFWMTTEGALHDDIFEKMSKARRILSLFLLLIGFIMIQKIYRWDGHDIVTKIAENDCFDNAVLQQLFMQMEEYLGNAQSTARKVFLYLFGLMVLIFSIAGLVNNKNRMIKLGFEEADPKEVKKPLL